MKKIGVVLSADGVERFESSFKKSTRALKEFEAEARKNMAALGNGAKAYDVYKTKVAGLSNQLNASKNVVSSLKSRFEELSKSNSDMPSKIEKASSAYTKQVSVVKNLSTAVSEQEKVVARLKRSYSASSTEVKSAVARLNELKASKKSASSEAKALENNVKSLTGAFDSQSRELAELPTKIHNAEASYHKLSNEIQRTHNTFKQNGGRLADVSSKLIGSGERLENVGQKMSTLGDGLSAVTAGISLGMISAGRSAIQFESDFAGVVKTVDGTPQELDAIKNSFLNMSTEIPVTANELSRIGEVAGQLGVKKDNIVGFTRVMADLGATTNLSSEEAATSLAQFMNVMGTSQDKVSNLGSSIVSLGNNFATNERDIVAMSQRLSGMGQITKMSEADVLGLAAAMSSVGIEAEAGGSAMTQVMNKIQNAVAEGGDNLELFASAAGVSADKFSSAFKERPVEALRLLLEGLKGVDKAGGNVNSILDDLGIKGLREADAVKRLAGALNGDSGLAKALDISNKGWTENNALAKEASVRYQTNASKIQMAKNELSKTAIEIGNRLLPNLADMLKNLKPVIKTLGELGVGFTKLPTFMQIAILGTGPFLSVMGRINSSVGGGVKVLGEFVRFLGSIRAGKAAADVARLGGAAATASKSIRSIGTAAANTGSMAPLLSNPYVLAGAAITAAVAGLGYMIYREMTKDSRNHEASVDKTNGAYQRWFDSVKKEAGSTGRVIDDLTGKVKSSTKVIEDEANKIKKINTEVVKTLDKAINGTAIFDSGIKGKLKDSLALSDQEVAEITSRLENIGISMSNSLASITSTFFNGGRISKEYASAQIESINNVTNSVVEAFNSRRDAELRNLESMKANGVIEQEEYDRRAKKVASTYKSMSDDVINAQKEINEILVNASKENRQLTENELKKIQQAYDKYMKASSKSITDNAEAQKLLNDALKETAINAEIAALKQSGVLTAAQQNYINTLGTVEEKQKALNKAIDEFASKNVSAQIKVDYHGENVVLSFKSDFERALNLPNIIKTIKIAEAEGRTIEMTTRDLNYLNSVGIHPKKVKLIDEFSDPLGIIKRNAISYTNMVLPKKSVMLDDKFSLPMDNILGVAKTYNDTVMKDKEVKVTDNASKDIKEAKQNLDIYNGTNPATKSLMAQGNVSPFANEGTKNLNIFGSTNPATKSLMAQGNVSPFANEGTKNLNIFGNTNPSTKNLNAIDNVSSKANAATSAINNIPSHKTSVIDIITNNISNFIKRVVGAHATGGHIDMFATGGNIGGAEWLSEGYQGIVGEAGPELFSVSKKGVNITPLSTREKIQGISGKLKEGKLDESPININFYISDNVIKEEADEDRIVSKMEKMLIRTMKEHKKGIGGGSRNVYSI